MTHLIVIRILGLKLSIVYCILIPLFCLAITICTCIQYKTILCFKSQTKVWYGNNATNTGTNLKHYETPSGYVSHTRIHCSNFKSNLRTIRDAFDFKSFYSLNYR